MKEGLGTRDQRTIVKEHGVIQHRVNFVLARNQKRFVGSKWILLLDLSRRHLEEEKEVLYLGNATCDVLKVSNLRQAIVYIRVTFFFNFVQVV